MKITLNKSQWQFIGKQAGWMKKSSRDRVELGPTPSDEDCAQVGTDNYRERAFEECRKYIALIRQKMGTEPRGARLKITSNPHDFGTYYEVVCEYDDQFPRSVDYAFACESDGPQTWGDTTPVTITPSESEDLSESAESVEIYEKNFLDRF